jgi:bile acid:Na+ symporter, BASS family
VNDVFAFFRSIVPIAAPVFVVSAMLNVGLTQRPRDILSHLRNYSFVTKMLVANFVVAPLLMIGALSFLRFDPALEAGLLIFSLCAGAPFLIKLTQRAEHDVALGAAVMMLLMVVTLAYAPLVLPRLLRGVTVDAWAIARSLLLQMLLPIAAGMLAARFLPRLARATQTPIGRLANIALYVVLGVTLIGYLPRLTSIVGTGALALAAAFVAVAFGAGYLAGKGHDHLEDVGGLGTGQRNTAAGIVIAVGNFPDPNVLVMLTLANTLGIVILLFIARALSRDNARDTLSADPHRTT